MLNQRQNALALLISFLCATPSAWSTPAFELPPCPTEDNKETKKLPVVNFESDQRQETTPALEKTETKDKRSNAPLSTLDKAAKANLMPLALIPSKNEAEKAEQISLERHKEQLKNLWSATIEQSPDIQFVISALQPNSNAKHATAAAMNLVGSTLFNVGGALAPNGPAKIGVNMVGPGLIKKLFSENSTAQVSVGETLVLYKMVRDIADNLVDSYWNYRRALAERDTAQVDLDDLKRLEEQLMEGSSNLEISKYEYLLHKAERELRSKSEALAIYQQHLADLCGVEALAKLNTEIIEEKQTLVELIGRPDIKEPLSAPKSESAFTIDANLRKKN